MLLFFTTAAPSAPGGVSGAPASLPHLGLLLDRTFTLTAEQGTYSLSGQDATLLGTFKVTADQGAYSITGQDATLGQTTISLVAESGTYAITGQDATLIGPDLSSPAPLPHLGLLGGFGVPSITGEQGAYSITGQDATLLVGRVLAADYGTYEILGVQAALGQAGAGGGDPGPLPHIGLMLYPMVDGYTLVADPGVYSIVGSDGLADYATTGEQGSYTLTGQDAGLRKDWVLAAEAGSYALSGQDVTFSIGGANRVLPADFGTYSLTGNDAGLFVGRAIAAEQGFYGLLGQQADLFFGGTARTLVADSGTYTLTGIDAALTPGQKVLDAEFGAYTVTGFNAGNDYVLTAESGSYALTGYDAEFDAPLQVADELEAIRAEIADLYERIKRGGGRPEWATRDPRADKRRQIEEQNAKVMAFVGSLLAGTTTRK